MEILHPITAWAWNDPVNWIEQVLAILKENDLSYPGIRELRAKLATGKVDCDTIDEFNEKANKLVEPAGLWFHPRHGLVYDGTDGTINRSSNRSDESPSNDSGNSILEESKNVDDHNLPGLISEAS